MRFGSDNDNCPIRKIIDFRIELEKQREKAGEISATEINAPRASEILYSTKIKKIGSLKSSNRDSACQSSLTNL